MPGTKWTKYGKNYNKDWEKESRLKDGISLHVEDDSKAVWRFCGHNQCLTSLSLVNKKNVKSQAKNGCKNDNVQLL